MNEKEAREILEDDESYKTGAMIIHNAKGYLEAIEKAKVLEEVIRAFLEGGECDFCNGFGCDDCKGRGDSLTDLTILEEALAQWEKKK